MLIPIFEEQFHDHSYGFRPNRCAQQAVLKALEMMNDGHRWIVDNKRLADFGLISMQDYYTARCVTC